MESGAGPTRGERKRVLSSEAGPGRGCRPCRLSMETSRSPLRTIQQARRRRKFAPAKLLATKKKSRLESCPDASSAAPDRARTTGAPPPALRAPNLSSRHHGHDTMAAARKERTVPTDGAERTSGQWNPVSQLVPAPAVRTPVVHQHSEMAEEYVEDILHLLLEEERHQLLAADFLAGQESVTPSDRAIIVDWLILVQHYLRLDASTLHLAVSLMDRVLFTDSCALDDLQLLGLASLWLAAKVEEPRLPTQCPVSSVAEAPKVLIVPKVFAALI
ncbi:cyclin-A3-2-like [Pollicipes pollicipes]|uniref:cyclin-A3-2-like n=1 Tax=Pollicipes pollicipes TaxID=41117 RepID=UPI001884D59F|nr:cyclin-A3-2-like [Pollicipes pollicipes]